MPGVIAFDLDGTLLRGTTVSQFLSERLGDASVMAALEERFARGEIDNRVIADRSAAEYAGVPKQWMWDELEDAPWIGGIDVVTKELHRRGYALLVATITATFAAELLQRRYRFDAISGTTLEEDDGILTGRVVRYFDPFDKMRFVEDFCRRRGVGLAKCVAVGDSRSDLPLFERAGYAVALNATAACRAAADVSLDCEELDPLLDVLDGWESRS